MNFIKKKIFISICLLLHLMTVNNLIAIGSSDNNIKLLDRTRKNLLKAFPIKSYLINLIGCGSNDKTKKLW